MKLELPQWYDLHAHFRQGDMIAPLIADHLAMGCAGILAMPNTKPPVAKIFKKDSLSYWSIEEYLEMLRNAGGDQFTDIIVPLYLTKDTTPKMIEEGARAGILRACKYYPPHGTTGAEFGIPFETFLSNGVFKAMEEAGTVLCIHGEEHGLSGENYFGREGNAEETFYKKRMPELVKKFPKLKIVCEHITTKVAADFVQQSGPNVAATITPQHLHWNRNALFAGGLRPHFYCLPVAKREVHRLALRAAATSGNPRYFLGTDSAPHAREAKEAACGCAGIFNAPFALESYVTVFDEENALDRFEGFASLHGPAFYGLPVNETTVTLERAASPVPASLPLGDTTIIPFHAGEMLGWRLAS